jgi:uncharacterized membrane protein YqgA involved in biofilm formation
MSSNAINSIHGIGTILNSITIVVGASVGVFVGEKLKDSTRNLITDILGLVTLLGATASIIPLFKKDYLSAIPTGWPTIPILLSLLLGGLLGSALRLEERFESIGEFLKIRFKSKEGSFVEGFLDASLLFVIGPLAILGSISDGMGTGIDQLVLKSTLDGFASIAFASTLGWGVAASALPVAVYQGSWTLIGVLLGNVMKPYQVDAMTIVGGLLLLGIALRLLKIKSIAIGNLLPALFIAPLIALVFHQFV